MFRFPDQQKGEDNEDPQQVGNDHDGLAGKPVGNDACRRPQEGRRDKLGNQKPADRTAGAGQPGKEDKNADVVEPVPQMAYNPGEPEPGEPTVGGKKGSV